MKIVFFGDSITESNRNLSDPSDLGAGFVKIAAGKLRLLYPDAEIEILNRGVGGDRTAELLQRVEKDVVDEHPDVVVLAIGVNDVWHRFVVPEREVSLEQFTGNYNRLVEIIKGTGAKLLLLQPFVLNMEDKPRLRPYLHRFNEAISEIAAREQLTLIPLDEIFTGLTQDIKPEQFSVDGVHPTHRGCRYIADLVIKELKKYL